MTGTHRLVWGCPATAQAGKAVFAWQTYAWSGGQWDSRAQLRQTRNDVTVGGAACDSDVSMAPATVTTAPAPVAPGS
jgi:hypothetical protein